MSLLYFDGFDAYPSADILSKYSLRGGSMVISSGAGRFSSGALQVPSAGGGGEVVGKFFSGRQTWIVGFAYKFHQAIGVSFDTKVISIQDVGGYQVEIWLTSNNQLSIRNNNGGVTLATGTTILSPDTFYYLEFKARIAASGYAEVRIGTITEVTTTGQTDPQATTQASRVVMHYDHFRMLPTFDDLYVCDDAGFINNDFLGDMRVETRVPTGQGTYNDFTGHGAASHYAAINESSEDGDSSYIASSNVNAQETFTLPNLTSNAAYIAGIQSTTIARKDDAGARVIAPLLKIGSNLYTGGNVPLTDSYTYNSIIFETNPATNAAWATDELEAAEIGVKLVS